MRVSCDGRVPVRGAGGGRAGGGDGGAGVLRRFFSRWWKVFLCLAAGSSAIDGAKCLSSARENAGVGFHNLRGMLISGVGSAVDGRNVFCGVLGEDGACIEFCCG